MDLHRDADPPKRPEKKLDRLREAVNTQILRAQTSADPLRKQYMAKDSFRSGGEAGNDQSPSLSSRSSSHRTSFSSSQRPVGASMVSNIHPGDYPFPPVAYSASASGDTNIPVFLRTGPALSDTTIRFRPSAAETTPIASRRPSYNTWSGPVDFPSPNIYDLTLKMNADIGLDSFWENIIDIFVTNFYASRVSLSIPYDLTDINNTPWGLKATYNGSIERQQTRIKLERRKSLEAPTSLRDSESESSSNKSEDVTPRSEFPRRRVEKKQENQPIMASIEEQLDSMLDIDHRGKVNSNLEPLEVENEPLIDNAGVKRVLDRGSIVVLSREYRDPEQMKRREEEILKTHQSELEEDSGESAKKKSSSVRSEVLAAWQKTFFKPPEPSSTSRYEEYEQTFASPWSQSPAPSPAILKESADNPFFQTVESSFSPNDDPDYTSSDTVYAIGMENHRSIIHIPLVHPHTSKSISSEGESSGSSGHPQIVPIAIISFLSTITPYPVHLITSLSAFAPLIATILSQAIRHSNVLHKLTHSPPLSSRAIRRRAHQSSPSDARRVKGTPQEESSAATHSSTTSEVSTPSWEIQGHLFSPAVIDAETPSPFRSTLNIETDYFSPRAHKPLRSTNVRSSSREKTLKNQLGSDVDDIRPPSSKSSWSQETLPFEPSQSSSADKQPLPIKIHRRIRKSPRMIHSLGATSQFSSNLRMTPKKSKRRRGESLPDASDPYQMHTPSSRLLKVVVDSIPVHVFTASPGSGTITWANGRTLAYRGVTAEAYIANPHSSIHPDDSVDFMRRWNRMLQLETDGMSQSVRIKRFDGQYRWFAARVVPLRDSRGSVVHWFGTAMDIHDAREAEINSARQEEIKASELKYRSLAEASPQIVFAATPALGILYANSQWMSYSGITYDETAKLGFLSFVHPEDRVRCALPVNGSNSQFSAEIRLQAADHSFRWHLVKCIRIEERDAGEDDVWLGTCTDIHDHKMLEKQLKQSNKAAKAAEAEHKKRAEGALETRRQQEFFIDMVSHELRNPLSAIVQSSEVVLNSLRGLLARESISSAISHELADDIETMKSIGLCTMHMRRLIDDTINVSKLESGMLQVTPVDCEPMTIVKQIQQIFDAELQSKRIEMSIIKDHSYEDLDIEWVRADSSRISQILINLLSNAIKFLDNRLVRKITLELSASVTVPKPDATPLNTPEVEVDHNSQDIYLSFSINDTGPGLKQAEMAALFQRFSQATPRTHVTYGGSGLGLFICKRLVELQGGRIYVDSVDGQGSTFSFYIKVERSNKNPKQPLAPIAEKEEDVGHSDSTYTHVLVVEDNLLNQRLLKKQLIVSGYRASVANHGQEAIEKVLAFQDSPKEIDIVLMDVEMPILNGLQATKVLREKEASGELRRHIPVIAVSANAREEQKKKMFDAGADGYLTKPFQLPELVAKLREQTEAN